MTQLKCVADGTKRKPKAEEWETFLEKRIPELIRRMKEGSLHPDTVNSTIQHVTEGKIMRPAVLRLVTTSIHFPGDTAFRVSDRFALETQIQRDGGADHTVHVLKRRTFAPITYYFDYYWNEWFGDLVVPASIPCDLDTHELIEYSRNSEIADELGDEYCETSPAVLDFMIERDYLLGGQSYVFHMKDKNGVRRIVTVYGGELGSRRVHAYTIDSVGHSVGCHVISPRRLVVYPSR
ncbi:MAG: hypothetical protein Q7S52_05510 [bacterium]|nr:hypothetical protein [bacterium]